MSLEPDRNQLEIFVEALFRHCSGDGIVSLRTFFEDGDENDPPYRITAIPLKGGLNFLIDAALDDARRAAQHPRPAVFCPPICAFSSTTHAREEDLLEGPVISVELDENPRAALATLEHLLGFATLVVRSGGTWTNPTTGAVEDKLHAYWRLKEPAQGKAALAKLKRLRRLATDLVRATRATSRSITHSGCPALCIAKPYRGCARSCRRPIISTTSSTSTLRSRRLKPSHR